jgi:hypothetical protein
MEDGGVTTGSTASCDLAIFGTMRLQNDADEVGGHPRADGVAPARLGLGLGAVYGGRRGGDPTAVRGPPRSCRGQPYAGTSRGRHVAGAAAARARRAGRGDGVSYLSLYST